MNWPQIHRDSRSAMPQARTFGRRNARRGLTMIEILVATALMLLIMTLTLTVFTMVGDQVSEARSTIEMASNLRSAAAQLEKDLSQVTVTMSPPRRPENGEGYFEYIEGPIGTWNSSSATTLLPSDVARDSDYGVPDWTARDFDDVMMFTVRSEGAPFVGRFGGRTIESQEAEVIWFVRGTTLYRRVLIIVPKAELAGELSGSGTDWKTDDVREGWAFWRFFDVSVHELPSGLVEANSLSDLTKRECRFAHDPDPANYPNDVYWDYNGGTWNNWKHLGLPTLRECSYLDPTLTLGSNSLDPAVAWRCWRAGNALPRVVLNISGVAATPAATRMDPWLDPLPYGEIQGDTDIHQSFYDAADTGARVGEDIVLTNVIGFDVKVWDPAAPIFVEPTTGAAIKPGDIAYNPIVWAGSLTPVDYGAYVDLSYAATGSDFSGMGAVISGLRTSPHGARYYDTWSSHYESDGLDQEDLDGDGNINPPYPPAQTWRVGADQGTNGFDDDGNGVVDDALERETAPPYEVPLRGLQVTIRVFEPDTKSIREVTIARDFLPK